MVTAEKLDGKLQQLRVQLQRGIINDEQATKQRAIAIKEATDKLAAQRKVGQHMADALPSRIISRAWPEDPPQGADRDLVRDELDHRAEGNDFFAGDLATYVTDALSKGRTTDAKLVLSRWGKAYARRRGVTDDHWATLQVEATRALAKVPGGSTSAATAKAMDLVDAAQRASPVGHY